MCVGVILGASFDGSRLSLAEEPTEAQIIKALQPKAANEGLGPTRSLAPHDTPEGRRFLDELRANTTRSLTVQERGKLAEYTKNMPSVDIEVNFDYNSATVGPNARKPLGTLGRALSSEQLKGGTFLINGHTDAKGSTEYNQTLSERRAEAVKRLLIDEFKLTPDRLIAVGYGKTQLKNPKDPLSGENRRVQVVNMGARQDASARPK